MPTSTTVWDVIDALVDKVNAMEREIAALKEASPSPSSLPSHTLPSVSPPPSTLSTELVLVGENTGKRSKTGTSLPETWELPRSWGEWAVEELHMRRDEVMWEAAKFKDHWLSKSGADARKRDWAAAWRNWCRRAAPKRTAPRTTTTYQSNPKGGLKHDLADILNRKHGGTGNIIDADFRETD